MGCSLVLLGLCAGVGDLWLLVWIAQHWSGWGAVALVLLSALLGTRLALHQGRQCLDQLRAEVMQLHSPSTTLVEGVLIFAAGLLMIFPGPLSTAVGLLLLVPPIRRLVAWLWTRRYLRRFGAAGKGGAPGGGHTYVKVVTFGGAPGQRRSVEGGRVDGLKPIEGREVDSKPLPPPERLEPPQT